MLECIQNIADESDLREKTDDSSLSDGRKSAVLSKPVDEVGHGKEARDLTALITEHKPSDTSNCSQGNGEERYPAFGLEIHRRRQGARVASRRRLRWCRAIGRALFIYLLGGILLLEELHVDDTEYVSKLTVKLKLEKEEKGAGENIYKGKGENMGNSAMCKERGTTGHVLGFVEGHLGHQRREHARTMAGATVRPSGKKI